MQDSATVHWSRNATPSCWRREPIALQRLTLRDAAYILRCPVSLILFPHEIQRIDKWTSQASLITSPSSNLKTSVPRREAPCPLQPEPRDRLPPKSYVAFFLLAATLSRIDR